MLQPSLHATEDAKCFQCREKIKEGDPIFHILLDFRQNGEPIFSTCCSKRCVEHSIEDHGSELKLQSRPNGR